MHQQTNAAPPRYSAATCLGQRHDSRDSQGPHIPLIWWSRLMRCRQRAVSAWFVLSLLALLAQDNLAQSSHRRPYGDYGWIVKSQRVRWSKARRFGPTILPKGCGVSLARVDARTVLFDERRGQDQQLVSVMAFKTVYHRPKRGGRATVLEWGAVRNFFVGRSELAMLRIFYGRSRLHGERYYFKDEQSVFCISLPGKDPTLRRLVIHCLQSMRPRLRACIGP